MVRWGVLAASVAVVAGAAFVTGASVPPKPVGGFLRPDTPKAAVATIGQKTGYFNMAAVMRGYRRATTAVERLNARKTRMSANLVGMREMYKEMQKASEAEKDNSTKEQLAHGMVMLARRIEDMDRDINKLLNDSASSIIVELYDEIHAATVEMAREHGLVAVLAFPDAVTPEEAASPMVKELKLKPPACQPFYLDPSVDYTQELIDRVNAKFAADNEGK